MLTKLNVFKEKSQGGFSLLELLLVVGVGALLLLAGIGTYQLVTSGSTANEAVRLIATVKQQTQRAYQGQNSYGAAGADLVPTLVAMQAFPSGVVNAAGTAALDPWGGTMVIESTGTNFSIEFPAVPTSACVQIGTTFTENDTDFVSLGVGGATFDAANPVVTANLATACGAAAAVSMTWTFF